MKKETSSFLLFKRLCATDLFCLFLSYLIIILYSSIRTKDAVATKEFWILLIYQAIVDLNIYIMTTMNKTFGELYIHDDHFFAKVVLGMGISNLLGRIFWGVSIDFIKVKVCR